MIYILSVLFALAYLLPPVGGEEEEGVKINYLLISVILYCTGRILDKLEKLK